MFNFSWAFKFWLDSPVVPVISMKEAVSFVKMCGYHVDNHAWNRPFAKAGQTSLVQVSLF